MRADLLALTPEGVAALANLGLVKRAQKEIAEGKGPWLAEDEAGVVTGTFGDGATARLVPGKSLRETPCSCGASTVCRHRVATALAYRSFHGPGAVVAEEAVVYGSGKAPAAPEPVAWSPGACADATLLARVGTRALDRAREAARSGVTVEVLRGPVPAAQLPSCTVRFHVPGELAYARCDCALGQDCEHVALAVWAFRQADRRDAAASRLVVDVREERRAGTSSAEAAAVSLGPLDEVERLAREVLLAGVVHSGPSLAQRFALAREGVRRESLTWPLTALEDLEELLDAYRARSARYHASLATELLAELTARPRAARAGGELPASFVLGKGEALETRLDHLRLVSLGARVEADGRQRDVSIYLADPDAGTVLVLAKRLSFGDGEEPPPAHELLSRRVAPGATLGALANGQVVTRVARRRANRSLVLGEARGGLTSVTPQTGGWEAFSEPLRVASASALESAWRARPPQPLRPRVLSGDVHVVEVAAVEALAYDPARQCVVATLVLPDGERMSLARAHRSAAPGALDALASALSGDAGDVRFVSGALRRHVGRFEIDPLAIAAGRLVVPDLAAPGAGRPLARVSATGEAAPIEEAIDTALSLLDDGVHHGLREAAIGYPERLRAEGARLTAVGLATSAERLARAAARLQAAREAGTSSGWDEAAVAFLDAAIRLGLLREAA